MDANKISKESINSEKDKANNKSTFGIKRLKFFYRPPVSVEVIPDSKMVKLEKNIQKHLDYNESCRARGKVKTGEMRTMGPYPFSR